ncbi:MAG: LacI family DNA-binding transcriptional regulator [Clostridiales bacterium]|nr:LacI family DNA-binding transcriptional regulator [Clostridiales bacterium]
MANKKTTMQDIATNLNISRMTVSKAFKGNNDISEETREKIFKIASELNYNYKTSAYLKILVLITPLFLEIDEQFYTKIYKKLIKESITKDIGLSMNVITDAMRNNPILPHINESEVDGLILLGELPKEYIKKLYKLNLPIVFIDFYNNAFKCDAIITNSYLYSYNITSHLISMGHTEIGFVGNIKSSSSVQDRYLGYYKALLENNIVLNESYIVKDRDAQGLLESFSLPSKLPTAFVCNNDYTAYNLINYLKSKNYNTPDDISIVGFDDVLDIGSTTPKLTTVRVNIDDMAHLGIGRIIQNITKKALKPKTYVINSTIIFRDSVKKLN